MNAATSGLQRRNSRTTQIMQVSSSTRPGSVTRLCSSSSSRRSLLPAAAKKLQRRSNITTRLCPATTTAALPARRQVAAAAAATNSSTTDAEAVRYRLALKQQFKQAVQGLDRGIFGVQAAKRQEVASIIEALEKHNPLQQPTRHLEQVAGEWLLLYTTITITGVKKTKLGLREFIKLGQFVQTIDIENKLALNVVDFSVAGLGMLSGSLTVKASYEPESDERVSIKFIESRLAPDRLQKLFEQNYELLLSIFNPEGWLDITYVDNDMRVGRDDKGNIFVLERMGSGSQNSNSS